MKKLKTHFLNEIALPILEKDSQTKKGVDERCRYCILNVLGIDGGDET